MYELAGKLRSLQPYKPLNGDYSIRLDANESFIKLDINAEGVMRNVNVNRYPDPYATSTVIAFSRLYGINPEFITAGNGSDELISIIFSCFLNKNDKVLTFNPDFSMYAFYPHLYELNLIKTEKNDLQINIDDTIAFVNESGVKCVMFSNPCNPTSLGVCRDDVIKLVKGTKALIVLDEAYMDFWDQSLLQDVGNYSNLIILKTCSKAIGLAAIRLGFAIACSKITKALRAAKSPYNVNSITQQVAFYVLTKMFDDNSFVANVDKIKESRDELYNGLLEMDSEKFGAFPEPKANFVYIKCPHAKTVFEKLLEYSIAIRHMGDYLRITAGTSDENNILFMRLKTILKEI